MTPGEVSAADAAAAAAIAAAARASAGVWACPDGVADLQAAQLGSPDTDGRP